MQTRSLMRFGLIGTVIAAICCATPILVVLLGAVGLGSLIAYLDMVLLPVLAVFVGITCFAMFRKHQEGDQS